VTQIFFLQNVVLLNNKCAKDEKCKLAVQETLEKTNYKLIGINAFFLLVPVPLRLAGGSNSSGRVEIKLGDHWGPVCHNKWSINNAHVVCRSFGYPKAYVAPTGSLFGPAVNKAVLDNIVCFGNESSLLQCKHGGFGLAKCSEKEQAGVFCEQPKSKLYMAAVSHLRRQLFFFLLQDSFAFLTERPGIRDVIFVT